MMVLTRRDERKRSRHWILHWAARPFVLFALCLASDGSVVLTQTHPAALYVCRTGNITLRCQYDGVEGVSTVLWSIGNETTRVDLSTIPGHTALPPTTTTYLDIVVDNYTSLHEKYKCAPRQSGRSLESNEYKPQIEPAEVTLSNLTLASRTATMLSVTWSAGYPKCYSFTVSHSTQDGSISVALPANSDTSHTLTSLQPGTTYRIEVEAVRKGDGADEQRAKVMENFTTEGDEASASTPLPTRPSASSGSADAVAVAGGVVGGVVLILVTGIVIGSIIGLLVYKRKPVPDTKASVPKAPSASQKSATQSSGDTKQTYAVLDWQNPEQRPVKAPENEWFTVQYSEVHFAGTK